MVSTKNDMISWAWPLRQIDIHASPRFVTEWLERRRT